MFPARYQSAADSIGRTSRSGNALKFPVPAQAEPHCIPVEEAVSRYNPDDSVRMIIIEVNDIPFRLSPHFVFRAVTRSRARNRLGISTIAKRIDIITGIPQRNIKLNPLKIRAWAASEIPASDNIALDLVFTCRSLTKQIGLSLLK